VEERKEPEVMKVLQMATVAANKVKINPGGTTITNHRSFWFSNKKQIKRLRVYSTGKLLNVWM
jgi:hypothetical protein